MQRYVALLIALALAASVCASSVAAHDHDTGFGRAAHPAQATRSMAIDMSDRLRFTPAEVSVRKDEVVRFVVRNSGQLMHEFVLGTLPN